jgi:hypothetical protein
MICECWIASMLLLFIPAIMNHRTVRGPTTRAERILRNAENVMKQREVIRKVVTIESEQVKQSVRRKLSYNENREVFGKVTSTPGNKRQVCWICLTLVFASIIRLFLFSDVGTCNRKWWQWLWYVSFVIFVYIKVASMLIVAVGND